MMGFVKGVLSAEGIKLSEDDGRPFSTTATLPVEAAKTDPWYQRNYFNPGENWREIEDDWLDMAGALALQSGFRDLADDWIGRMEAVS